MGVWVVVKCLCTAGRMRELRECELLLLLTWMLPFFFFLKSRPGTGMGAKQCTESWEPRFMLPLPLSYQRLQTNPLGLWTLSIFRDDAWARDPGGWPGQSGFSQVTGQKQGLPSTVAA